MRVAGTVKAALCWVFEIGRKYRLETAIVFKCTFAGREYYFYIPAGFVCDAFSYFPNLRTPKGTGACVSYRSFWGLGPRRKLWISHAAIVHDWIWAARLNKRTGERDAECGCGARDDHGQWVTWYASNEMFRVALQRDGYDLMDDVCTWALNHVSLSRDMWNSHGDGRPVALSPQEAIDHHGV